MNRVYKVIYNRARNLYQVVSEIVHSRGKTKSLTAQHQHERLTTAILIALFAMGTSLPVGWAAEPNDTTTDTTTVEDAKVDASNLLSDDNKTAWRKALGGGNVAPNDAKLISGTTMYNELRSGMTSTATINAGNTVAQNLSALDQAIGKIATDGTYNYIAASNPVSTNLSTLDTQVKSNADAIRINTSNISANKTAIDEAIDELKTSTTTNLATKANINASNLTSLSKTDLTAWGTALGKGTIAAGNKQLVTGEAIYNELTPTGTVYYIGSATTTAARLTTLDNTLKTFADQLGVDLSNNTNLANQLYKYFKVNPKATTTDGTTTYDPEDAAANGTNSVAIGPSAQAGEKTTDAPTAATTGIGGTSSTAIGDSAKANGDQSVALGYGSEVLNTTDQSGKATATISGSTAIGKEAKVNGAEDATAVGTSAQVNETATGGIAFGKNAVTGEDKGTVTVGDVTADVAAVGGKNSVALGTSAKASGNTALALGKGAQVNNYTTQSGTTVTKTVNSGSTAIGSGAVVTGANDAVAFGSGAKVEGTGTNADDSLAIGKSASVATAKDAMALGTSAFVASGADNAIALGNTARANTTNATAIGYNATATGAGAVAIGENTSTSTEGGISIGSGTSVSGKSIVIGYATDNAGNAVKTESNNTDAVAIGNGAQANANDSISIGHQAGKDTAEGRTSGYGSLIAIGTNAGNNVKGMQNVALGSGAGSNVKSSYNVAIGSNAGAGINYAAATDSNPQNGYNVSIGYEANYQSADANAKNIAESIAIGHSANAVSNATAMGYQTTASGDKSMAFGYNATAADTDSIAFGDNASAGGGNIAIGHGSQAPAVTSYSSSYLTNNPKLNGYISLGGKTTATSNDRILRRITNVADGSDDQDAVTVAQLKAAYTNLEGTIKTTDTKISDTYTQEAIDTKIKNVESKITASKTKYFSINTSSDTLTANADSDGASTSGAADAMAIGPNASASSSKAVAIGNNVSASGKGSIALGTADNPATTGTVDVGKNTSANPHVTSAEGANSVAIGTSAIAQTDNSVALGTRASVYTSDVTDKNTGTTTKVGQQSIAIGYQAETRNSNATSIGSDAKAYSNGSTAIGHGAYAQGADAIVLGTSSRANSASSGILGKSNTINGSNTYAVGIENNVNGNWGAVTYSGLYGSKNTVNPVADTSGNTKHGMDSLSITGNSNTISQGSYSDTVQNISILGNSNSVTGANSDEANAGTTANITVIGGNNEVTGRDGAGSDYMGKTWNQLTRTSVIGYGNKVNQATSTTSLADTQILGNDVTATLGNSVYLGTGSSAKNANSPDTDTLVKAETDAANAVDTTGMTDDEKTTALSDAKAKARYAVKLAAMKANKGSTAGTEVLNTDTTYDDGTSYTYAGSSPVGVVTVGKAGSERRIQNVAAGLVSASSTDAVNGSQLYALTRQIRFGGDNSSFGTTTADDKNVVARGSNETIAITGGSDAVTASTTDGNTTYTVDATKLTDNNIAVVADTDKNALHVQLASNLKNLNTAQLGSGSGGSYKETIKLDGTGTNGGQMTLAGADGTVKTTIDTTGLTVANGPKFTSSGIDAASQKINNVTAGTSDTDAVNYGQLKNARTLLKQGANNTLSDTVNGDQHTYTVNVDNLAVKANGTGTTVALANGINFKNGTNTTSAVDSNGNVTIDTKNLTLKANDTNQASVSMDGGINFKDGTNTTATVGTDGMVTISATHNKLDSASYTASKPSDSSNQTTVKLKDTDGNETTLNLTDTYTTVSKNTDHTISFKRNDGSNPVSISLDDLNGASNEALTKAAAKATTTVIKGTNVDSVDDDTTSADGHHIYKVNVSNLGVKVADGQKKSVALSDGLVFGNGTNTTASVGDNGAITFNVSNDAIKTQAKDAINMEAGTNVNVDTETSKDGLSKTFTISATHNALKSATLTSKSNDVSTLTITDNDGKTASVDIKNTHLTVTKDSEAKTVTFTSNDGTTPATTLSLSDLGAASTADMNAAKAAASTEVQAGTNASLGAVETNQTDQHKIYTVNVDNLGLKQNGTAAGTVTLADGINFADGTNTSATVSDGKVTFDLKRNVTGIDTVTANNSIQAGDVKVGKQGTDNKNYVTGLDNKNWTVGQTTYEAGRAATEDQLKSVSDKVASGFQVTDGTTSANIGADKKVTFTNGNYTTAKVTQGTDGANVQYDINTAKLTTGANGTITALTTDGVATAANVAEAINSAAWKIKANDNEAAAIKAGTTVGLKAGNNLTLSQSGTDFTYALNDELTGIKSLTTVAQDGVTTTLAASGVTITPNGTGTQSVSLTSEGLDNGNHVIKNVASGGTERTNAANIGDLQDAISNASTTATNTGFKVKGDDATSQTVKLGKQLNVVGGTTDSTQLSTGNIGVETTADAEGNATLTVKLNKNINLDSVKAGNTILDTNGVSNGKMNLTGTGMTITDTDASKQVSVTTSGVSMGSQRIQNVANAEVDTDAATLGQVKNARTVVAGGSNVAGVTPAEGANNQMTYTVNVDNLSVKANSEEAKSVMLKNGLTFKDGTNTTASVGEGGVVSFGLKSEISLTKVTTGNTTMDTNGLVISGGPTIAAGGINAGGKTITGVANGVGDNDAVNISQLKAVQSDINAGWTIKGKDTANADVSANIGKGKTVTYNNGSYTKAVVTKDDSGNAAVTVDVTTGTLTTGTDGKITSADGLATTGDVANAVNSASWTIQDGNNTDNAQQVKAGDKVSLKAGDNLSLEQNGKEFTYKLNQTLTNMNSVTAVDDKQNTAVLNGEGLKVTDAQGNALTQHATEVRLHDANKAVDDTTTDVVLNKQGLQNGGHTITGVADGTVDASSQDAVNGSQLYALQQKVTNGWKITGADTTKASNIGNDKTVSFVNGDNSYIKSKVDTTNTGATVSYTAQTASLTNTDGKAALTGTMDGLVTGRNLTSVLNNLSWMAQSSKVGSGQNSGSTSQSIAAGSKVSFIAGDNMILTQDGTNFTYALNSSLTGMNTIAFTGLGNGASNLTIGLQNGGGANPDKGYYITGLSNTKWDQSNYEGTRAATEAQLREAIDKVSAATGTGGFGLTADEGANNGGEKKVSQTLGRTIAIQGDGTYGADGTVVKQGNISTVAYTDNAGPTGAIKVKLNKDIDLSEAGSLTIGASKVSAGSIVLDNTGDAAKKIALNSTAGTASIGGVTVNGAAKTVMGLANTTWDGTAVSGRAATEDQLAKAISDVSEQATNSELHIRKGTYGVGKDKDGQDVADPEGKNSVSIDVVNATGTVDGQVVINDVAKASELGAVGELAANLKNPAGGPTTVVQAVNKVNQKVDDSLKQVNGDITSAVTEAKKHTKVAHVDGDSNVIIDDTQKTDDNGTVYKLGLNKEYVDLNQVHIYGNKGRVTAKTVEAETVEAETVRIDDKTNLDKTGLTTGNTTVADGRVVVGGDNGIKIEAKGDQQTISGLSNRIWTGKAVSGRAATEDQLQQAVENATATAAQNEQHIQSGNYDVGQGKGLDGKPIGKNSVAINVVSGDGTKLGDVKGQVVINNVAKADELGDVAKLNGTVRNGNGHPTSTVDAINNLDNRVETKVGDNTYSRVKGKEIADGDSATTAIGKLNNRMNDIYTTAGQHSTVSTADANLTLSEGKNASGGTDYKLGLNKENINLGNVTINGNAGSIKADSFTAGDTVVNKDGVKVGDKSALTGDSLKVGGKTYVDDKGVDANGQAIRNVGDGKNDGDAVNVKQVNDLAARQGEAIGQNAAHINQLDRAVNRLDSRINRVGTGAAALAALHPGNYDPDDKVDFAAGFGNYRGASAAAVGMYYHPDETTTMSVGASFGGGENMVNAGITWKMGKNSGHMRTQAATKAVPVQFVAAPTQTTQSTGQTEGTKTPQPVTAVTTTASGQQVPIVAAYLPSVDNSTRAENDELKELLARQTAILEKLAEQKTAAAPAAAAAPVSGEDLFPDVPENHWAYDFVAKLAKAGALKDCRVEAPANNPMLTRNDFAQILYTALKNGATKNPALNKDNGLNRLASEFRVELKNVRR
ncbi:ESPR-type extended signal peptide-containing protein [Mitsuokella multacida]|uniref:ESPR-type extended signal peptide-containing protein n=1 Tax=Mitsuokella multacida TaxID=52226 RepID=UPI00242D95A3|nr:ESPR-type extended signal peptide-containing protein [Mitsuokella multacida]